MPDMATITLNNTATKWSSTVNQGDAVEVLTKPTQGAEDGAGNNIFKGEVVGVEPIWEANGETKCIIRAFNKLHRLTRGRKAKSFQNKTDHSIAEDIARGNGLTPECSGDASVTHEHLYQYNLTDLEFLLQRAARINYEVWCEDQKLFFKQRKPNNAPKTIEVAFGAAGGDYIMQRFAPRLSSAGQVQEVNVRAWKFDSNETIVGKATAVDAAMGDKDGPSAADQPFGKKFYYEPAIPVPDIGEANAIAKAKFEELAMNYIVGEGRCMGHPDYKVGVKLKITLNDERFDGDYYCTGVTHRYSHSGSSGGGGSGGGYFRRSSGCGATPPRSRRGTASPKALP